MKKKLLLLAALALVALAVPQAARAAKPVRTAESWPDAAYTSELRDYRLYVPAGTVPKKGRPLVVYLHGCTQNDPGSTDPEVGFGTRWNELAAREGVVVLYPLQRQYDMEHPETVEGNGASCWNWFLDKNMHRDMGEPAVLASLTRQIMTANHIDPERVYAMGTSAGADMTNVLNITYPDLFKAAAMFAGCAYATCSDSTGTLAAQELADHGQAPAPAIIFQGSADSLNNVGLGQTLLRQQVAMRGLDQQPTSTEEHGDATTVAPGQGNICIELGHAGYPCIAGVTGWPSYPYTVEHYGGGEVEWWLIHGLNHDYPYGDYRSNFTDPAGPDITTAAWEFFERH
jgi:poly(hydroxyalkanoate) depolymerase family esterase